MKEKPMSWMINDVCVRSKRFFQEITQLPVNITRKLLNLFYGLKGKTVPSAGRHVLLHPHGCIKMALKPQWFESLSVVSILVITVNINLFVSLKHL